MLDEVDTPVTDRQCKLDYSMQRNIVAEAIARGSACVKFPLWDSTIR